MKTAYEIETATLNREQSPWLKEYARRKLLELREQEILSDKFVELGADQLRRMLNLPVPPRQMIAETAAQLAADSLRITAPQVHEILPHEHAGTDGFPACLPRDHRIHVRLQNNCACRVAEIAFHETRHRWQIVTGRFHDMLGKNESEPDAESYAKSFVAKFNLTRNCQCYRRPK